MNPTAMTATKKVLNAECLGQVSNPNSENLWRERMPLL